MKIVLKNSDKLQTKEITYDGFNFIERFIQHGVMMIVLAEMESVIGDADETVKHILADMFYNGFLGWDSDNHRMEDIRDVVHSIDKFIDEE